jgi:hypothetical protein
MMFIFALVSGEEYFRIDYARKQMISVYNHKDQRGIRIVTDFSAIKTLVHTLLSDSPQYKIISAAEFFDVHNDIITKLAEEQDILYNEQFNN